MANAPKEHAVIETNTNGRTTWKSVPGSAVAFYASAADSLAGSAELHSAAAEAFSLEGKDYVWVICDGVRRDAVTVSSPDSVRALMAEFGIEVAA
jgi:hypothetical protein